MPIWRRAACASSASAEERIREDYLRILRFLRFTAEYADGAPDADSLAACVRERAGLAQLSPERVRQEMLRLLSQARAPELIEVMRSYGLLAMVLPAVPRPAHARRGSPPSRRRSGATATRCCGWQRWRSRYPRTRSACGRTGGCRTRRRQSCCALPCAHPASIRPHPSRGPGGTSTRTARTPFAIDVLIEWARSGAKPDDPGWRNRLALPERWQAPKFPIGGADVMALGVPAGPWVGIVLSGLEGWWMGNDFAPDETELRAKLREVVEELEHDQP